MRLIDNFMPVVGYVVLFKNSIASSMPSFPQVKADIQRLFSQSEGCVRRGECAAEDYDQARFIVCAWVDEVLLGSSWSDKNLWQREMLQRLYYNTTDAGVEVFDRLNQLGFQQKEVREVYYLCLSLGFRGRFINPGDDFLLDQLRTSNLKILTGASSGTPSLEQGGLFPEAFPTQMADVAPQPVKTGFSMVVVAALAGPVVLFGLLYLVYHFTLGSVASKIF